jgi:putative drug exporter of the RND superfamily
MLRRISGFATGRRSKWIVVAVWVLVALALGPLQPKLQEATTNEPDEFLPASADSTEVNDLVESRFARGNEAEAIILVRRESGLTPADERLIADEVKDLVDSGELEYAASPLIPFTTKAEALAAEPAPEATFGPELVSADGDTALALIPIHAESGEDIADDVDAIRSAVSPALEGQGLEVYVTGAAGFLADALDAFETIDGTLLTVTVALVLVLLLAIYRSPVIALVPLFVVGLAYAIAAGGVYALVEAGAVTVNGQTTGILIVLLFGAGTDYCLLIVSRYREELRHTEDKHAAMARATERTAPAILSAGATVFASMLVLTLADFKATQTMGPVLALGIAIIVLAGLTLLPAVLSVLGRGAFWPARPTLGSEQRTPLGLWRRIGHLVHDHPLLAGGVVVAILLAGSLGNLLDRGALDFGEGFRDDPESVLGQDVLEQEFSPGQAAASTVLVARPASDGVAAALEQSDEIESVIPMGTSDDGEIARLDVMLTEDPFSDAATSSVPEIRRTVQGAADGETALFGGITAEGYDTNETLQADATLIIPLILLVVLLILVALLRAIVAPLYLVATVVLSFGFALGASNLAFEHIFDQPAGEPSLPTFAFIFLVALGVDYNIFLISRIREEAGMRGTKEGVIAGLEKTGGVITSAGLILAGTFSALMALPLEALFQLGFCVALGLLVDTFLIRTVLVPAIAFQLGERNWWPSRLRPVAARATD